MKFVSVHNHNSSLKLINIGVPQGSILGPLLFLIHMNDIPNATLSRPRLFTDETCLIVSSTSLSTLEQECNIELKNLQTWCNANKLEINPKNSAFLLILSKLNAPKVNLDIMYDNECPVANSENSRYLGLILDSKLNYRSHIRMVENKIARSVGIMNKLRYLFPTSTLLQLYYSHVHPHLLFGLLLCDSTYPSYLTKLYNGYKIEPFE